MIDIHSHIMPGIDDGSRSMGETMKMLKMSAASGVSLITATPHFNHVYNWMNYADRRFLDLFESVRENAEERGIGIELRLGMEIRAFDGMIDLLEQGRLLTLAGTKYVLTEFDEQEPAKWAKNILRKLLSAGYIPVVAHPERYDFVGEDPWQVSDWLEDGCLIQITRGSMTGSYGPMAKELSDLFLEEGFVTCVASDCHRPDRRTPEMTSGYEYLRDRYSERLAERLMTVNPGRIVRGERI